MRVPSSWRQLLFKRAANTRLTKGGFFYLLKRFFIYSNRGKCSLYFQRKKKPDDEFYFSLSTYLNAAQKSRHRWSETTRRMFSWRDIFLSPEGLFTQVSSRPVGPSLTYNSSFLMSGKWQGGSCPIIVEAPHVATTQWRSRDGTYTEGELVRASKAEQQGLGQIPKP